MTARCYSNDGDTPLKQSRLSWVCSILGPEHAVGIGVFFNGENTGVNLLNQRLCTLINRVGFRVQG